MAIDSEQRKLLLLVVILAMATLAGCSTVSLPAMCWTCDRGIENVISNGSDSPVASTALEIELESDGDAHWHVRAELDQETVSRLDENGSTIDRIGEQSVYGGEELDRRSTIGEERIENVSSSLRNGTLHARFHVDDFAEERLGGILFLDAFQSRGQADRFQVGADRLVLRGPNGTVLLNDPPSVDARPDDRTLVWTEPRSISKDMYVVYGADGVSGRITAQGHIAVDVFDWAGPRLLAAVPFVGIWASFMLVIHRLAYRSRDEDPVSVRRALVNPRFATTVAGLVLLTGYVTVTGTQLALWIGGFPFLALVVFGAHAIAVTMDSTWRFELAACIAVLPLIAFASLVRRPEFLWSTITDLGYLMVLTVTAWESVASSGPSPICSTRTRTGSSLRRALPLKGSSFARGSAEASASDCKERAVPRQRRAKP